MSSERDRRSQSGQVRAATLVRPSSPASARSTPAQADMLALQRQIGNGATTALVQRNAAVARESSEAKEQSEESKASVVKDAQASLTETKEDWEAVSEAASSFESAGTDGFLNADGTDASDNLESVGNKWESPLESLKKWVFGDAADFVSAIKSFGMSILTLRTKKNQRAAFREAAEGAQSDDRSTAERNRKPKSVEDIGTYGAAKTHRGVLQAVAGVIEASIDLAGQIAALFGGFAAGLGAAFGAVVALIGKTGKLVRTVFNKAKGIWKFFTGTRGKNRETNAQDLVDRALGGDEAAAKLIIDLRLDAVEGGAVRLLKRYAGERIGGLVGKERLEKVVHTPGEALVGDKGFRSGRPTVDGLKELLKALKEKRDSGEGEEKAAAENTWDDLLEELADSMKSTV